MKQALRGRSNRGAPGSGRRSDRIDAIHRREESLGPDRALGHLEGDIVNRAAVRRAEPIESPELFPPAREVSPSPGSVERRVTMADVLDGQRGSVRETSLLHRLPRLLGRERELAVARLASTLTHTLGTPLQVISGRAALARKSADPEELERHLEIVQRKCSEITALLWRVLDSLRVEQEPTLEAVDVAPFVEGLVGELRAAAAARGVVWTLELPRDADALNGLRLRRSDLGHALLSLGLGVLGEAPDGSELRLVVEKAEEEARGLTPVHDAVLRFTFRRAWRRAAGSAEPYVADPWLHTDGQRVDGQAIGWAAVHELVRGNEGRVEVGEETVVLSWPAVP